MFLIRRKYIVTLLIFGFTQRTKIVKHLAQAIRFLFTQFTFEKQQQTVCLRSKFVRFRVSVKSWSYEKANILIVCLVRVRVNEWETCEKHVLILRTYNIYKYYLYVLYVLHCYVIFVFNFFFVYITCNCRAIIVVYSSSFEIKK